MNIIEINMYFMPLLSNDYFKILNIIIKIQHLLAQVNEAEFKVSHHSCQVDWMVIKVLDVQHKWLDIKFHILPEWCLMIMANEMIQFINATVMVNTHLTNISMMLKSYESWVEKPWSEGFTSQLKYVVCYGRKQ